MQINLSQTHAAIILWVLGVTAIFVPFSHKWLDDKEQAAVLAALAFTKGFIGIRAYSLTPSGNLAENPPTKQQVEAQENAAAAKGKKLDGSDLY